MVGRWLGLRYWLASVRAISSLSSFTTGKLDRMSPDGVSNLGLERRRAGSALELLGAGLDASPGGPAGLREVLLLHHLVAVDDRVLVVPVQV